MKTQRLAGLLKTGKVQPMSTAKLEWDPEQQSWLPEKAACAKTIPVKFYA
jgi:hypothetical protein